MTIILASTSIYRKQLLERLRLDFACVAPQVDESPLDGETAIALVDRLAALKAMAVANDYPGELVIGSDQTVLVDGHLVGKAGTVGAAIEQLENLSGREVIFETSVALICLQRGISLLRRVPSKVTFRPLSKAEIIRYIELEMPLDCAGSFKAEALGISLFESIHSTDPSALIGLPLIATAELLRQAGIQIP